MILERAAQADHDQALAEWDDEFDFDACRERIRCLRLDIGEIEASICTMEASRRIA